MRIVHFSDIHFGAENPALVEALIDRTNDLMPDLVVASGDFAMAGRTREFRAAGAMLARIDAPIVATPGNHDIPAYNLWDRFIRPSARYDRWIGNAATDRFRERDVAILALNSARPWEFSFNWSHGRLSRAQIEDADRFFADASGARFRALVVHHPFHVPDDLPGFRPIGNAGAMLRVLGARRVHAVFSGHLHRRGTIARRVECKPGVWTVQLLQVGSATSPRQRDGAGGNGFSVVDVSGDRATVTPWSAIDGAFTPGEPDLFPITQAHGASGNEA
jgi:3',5'-cyclic AMP phosphodiesterase CpdA